MTEENVRNNLTDMVKSMTHFKRKLKSLPSQLFIIATEIVNFEFTILF